MTDALQGKLSSGDREKLELLGDDRVLAFVAEAAELCEPEKVWVCTDSDEDIAHVRATAVESGEERRLSVDGHTLHFDGPRDQGRDKANTKYLVPEGLDLGGSLNAVEREAGLAEVRSFLRGAMRGKTMIVRFLCLGPAGSEFAIPSLQITDSWYVAHSESLLYRPGYDEFRRRSPPPQRVNFDTCPPRRVLRTSALSPSKGRSGAPSRGGEDCFFRFLHSAGELERGVSKDVEKRRIYIDIVDEVVYSVNCQYGGNTIGLKKLALRLAIRRAARDPPAGGEGWLAEHMFVMGVKGPGGRVTYLTGAFPSGCGKTSTAMLPGESIVGDDIAFLRVRDGRLCAANTESGIFGIIRDVNPGADPIIWDVLTKPGEVIFSNVLLTAEGQAPSGAAYSAEAASAAKAGRPALTGVGGGTPRWHNDGRDEPVSGVNYAGEWTEGARDAAGKEIAFAHWNARYTVRLADLANCDPRLDDPGGVPVGGVMYGGRDPDANVPVMEALDWAHGVVTMGASLESEATAAAIGEAGQRKLSPMANMDFVAIPLGEYVKKHLDAIRGLTEAPKIYATNYFQKGADGRWLTGMADKRVWVKWIELRVHGDVAAVETPVGRIPAYDDLVRLFREVLDEEYPREAYEEQFALRVVEHLAKLDRAEALYRDEPSTPEKLFEILQAQRERLEAARKTHGERISPFAFEQLP